MNETIQYEKPTITEQISLERVENEINASSSNPTALAVLYHAGEEQFVKWPDSINELYTQSMELDLPLQKLIRILAKDYLSIIGNLDAEHTLTEKELKRRNILDKLLEYYVLKSTDDTAQKIYNSRVNQEDKFWTELLPTEISRQDQSDVEAVQNKANSIIQSIDTQEGANMVAKYQAYKTQYYEHPELTEKYTEEVLTYVESAMSRQNSAILFERIRALKEIGLTVDDYIRISTGMNLAEIEDLMGGISQQFKITSDTEPYRDILSTCLYPSKEINMGQDDSLTEAIESMLEKNEGNILRVNILSGNPQFFIVVKTPNLEELTTCEEIKYALASSDLYNQIKEKAPVIIVLIRQVNDVASSDNIRTNLHEDGHLFVSLFNIRDAMNHPALFAEIPSVLMELFHPDQEYIRAAQRFLTTRYAGLALHEVKLWRTAELVVDEELTQKEFYEKMENSYAEYGKIISAKVTSGRWGTDSLDNMRTKPFGNTASYAIGGVLAPNIFDKHDLKRLSSTEETQKAVVEIYQNLSKALSKSSTLEQLLINLRLTGKDFKGLIKAAYDWYSST